MVLQPASAFDRDTAIGMWLNQWIAQDPNTGAYLTVSNGRRRNGRNRRYCVTVPTCNLVQYEPSGPAYPESLYFGLTAENDAAAIEKANARLVKELGKAA